MMYSNKSSHRSRNNSRTSEERGEVVKSGEKSARRNKSNNSGTITKLSYATTTQAQPGLASVLSAHDTNPA